VRDRGISKPADSETRQLLGPEPGEAIGYRRVRLTCGGRTLSEADNWYLPGRLTPVMNKELQETDTPFGLVVAPLSFHRRTLDITPLTGADGVLRVRAVLVSGAGAPFSVVVETYSWALIAVTPPDR
jgi:chorismate-pyruvate lyase